jgi:hypothetical protein
MLKRSRDKRAEEDFGFGLYVTPTRSHLFVSFFSICVCKWSLFSLSLLYAVCFLFHKIAFNNVIYLNLV